MRLNEIAKELEGLQTVSTISKTLKIKKRTAINYVWRLRKAGYLTTDYGKRKIRIYKISTLHKKKKGYSFYELLNKNSKIKLSFKEDYIIHSEKRPNIEEILVRAIATGEFRVVLASLALFNKIKKWSRLYKYAKKNNIRRKVGALYDVAKTIIKVRRIDNKTRNLLLKAKENRKYIIKGIKSKDFTDIEKEWRVYIPFSKQDLLGYKE